MIFMTLPVVAIPADIREFDGTSWHAVQTQYVTAVVVGAKALPLLVPALEEGHDIEAVLDRVDGVLISGSRSNVYPALYGKTPEEKDGPFDHARDATTLPLIRRAIERGVPLFAICRGIQELNVALGGTLASEIQELPGRDDHRRREAPDRDGQFAIHQPVRIAEGSCLAGVLGAGEVRVNSLHRQAISQTAPSLAVEAVAEDGTVEAVSVIGARAFAVGVQWHPEYWVRTDPVSASLFAAFGDAVRTYAASKALVA
jgi:putative glutamine amidotransferase